MCGIVGIVAKSYVNQTIFDALTVLQHRGQDAAGMVTCEGDRFSCVRIMVWSTKYFVPAI